VPAPARLAFALVLALAPLLGACTPIVWTRTTINQPMKPNDFAFISPGQTTWREVTDRLGAPNVIDPGPGGLIARYFSYDSAYFDADLGYGLNYVNPILAQLPHSLDTGGNGIGGDILTVVVNHAGIVTLVSFSKGDKTARFDVLPTEH
jgi:hypothetical protein